MGYSCLPNLARIGLWVLVQESPTISNIGHFCVVMCGYIRHYMPITIKFVVGPHLHAKFGQDRSGIGVGIGAL